ncbi:MAG: hypothetical protein R3B13_18260 [Polyangiaceae bacterium]
MVDVRAGERRDVVLAFATLFGLVAAISLLETARDALFLAKLPAKRLALVYAIVALLGLVAAKRNLAMVRRFGRKNSLAVTLAVAAVGTTLLYFRPADAALVFALYVWSALLGSVAVVQFWLLANESFTSAQSKRLFPLLSAGGVIGAVAGSSLAVVLLARLPVGILLPAAALAFLGTATVVTFVRERDSVQAHDPLPASPPTRPGRPALLLQHPYLLRIGVLVTLSTVGLLLLDYLFKSRAAAQLSQQELAPFFARYYAVLNALSLAMQVVIAPRLVRRLGTVAALAFLPLALLLSMMGVLLAAGSFALVIVAKGADGTLRHSVHRVASELLYVPLDGSLRNRVKPLLDSVLARSSQAVGAACILGLGAAGLDSPGVLASIVAGLAAAWVVVALSLRAPYLEAFRTSLGRGGLDDARIGFDNLDLTSVEAVTEALSSPEPTRALAAINLLADAKRTRLIPALILYHESEEVVLRALAVVPEARRRDWIPLAERLMTHSSEAVRLAAVRALARHRQLKRGPAAPSGAVRAYLVAQHVRASQENPADNEEVRSIVQGTSDDCQVARRALLDAVVDSPEPRWTDVILQVAEHEGPEVEGVLPEAMAAVGDPKFVPLLIQRLARRRTRVGTRLALARFGEDALWLLGKTLVDPSADFRTRLQVPRAIAEIGTQAAADVLAEALAADIPGLLRYRALRALGHLVTHHGARVASATVDVELRRNLVEFLKLEGQLVPLEREAPPARARASRRLVTGLLKDKMRYARERIFRLLQLQYRSEDLRSVHFALESSDRRVRANALEFVDALTIRASEEFRALLRLVVDDLPREERALRAEPLVGKLAENAEAVLAELMLDPDDALATIAAYHAHALQNEALALEAQGVMSRRGWMELHREVAITGLESRGV